MYLKKNKKHIKGILNSIEQRAIHDRKYFHENPELSLKEKNTSDYIVNRIKELRLEYSMVGDYGIIAQLNGELGDGKTIMLRADMDALPINESKNNLKQKKKFSSNVDGISHACGHDAHMAILLSAMEALYQLKSTFKGRVLFVFEQAEEIGQGVQMMIEALSQYKIDACWGIHVYSELESGKICVDEGPRMAGVCGFTFKIKGQGGHSSRPDKCINPINTGVSIINTLNSIWATELDPIKTVTLGISNFQAGVKPNIIAEEAVISGSLRFFDKELGLKAFERLKEVVLSTSEIYNCKAEFTMEFVMPDPVINDRKYSMIAKESIKELLGNEVLQSCEPWFASESMERYLAESPGVFAFLGIKDEEYGSGSGHHTPEFDMDDKILKNGIAATVTYTLNALNTF